MKYLDEVQDGVIIPHLCQLEWAEVGSLSFGRCGTVKSIRWNGCFVVVKEYATRWRWRRRTAPHWCLWTWAQSFYRLKSLWGQYVPHLLFHNPLSTSRPWIGMKVGQPMETILSNGMNHLARCGLCFSNVSPDKACYNIKLSCVFYIASSIPGFRRNWLGGHGSFRFSFSVNSSHILLLQVHDQ